MKFLDRIGEVLKWEKIAPIHACPGDTIELGHYDDYGNHTVVLSETITEHYTFDEAVIWKIDDDDYRGLGGAFLECKNT